MTELIYFAVFSAALVLCIITNVSILYALLFGFFLFFGYGLFKKFSFKEMLSFSFDGIKTVKNILLTFILIGMLTAVWRICGTIPFLVYHAAKVCTPDAMILITFLLCGFISTLTGTAFGTVATVGVICMTLAGSMGISEIYIGGAILSGCFLGDRCSPVSTSALLISELTHTDIFKNMITMVKTALVPFILSCVFYFSAGLFFKSGPASSDILNVLSDNFSLSIITVIPAAVIIILSLFKVNVKRTMALSIISGIIIALSTQHTDVNYLVHSLITGFHPQDRELNVLLSGGGLTSMVNVFLIVCLSSCYSGIFDGTGFLSTINEYIKKISNKITPFGSILVTSIMTGFISCNQTLSIMLTHQLCQDIEGNKETLASHLENTAVVISALIPWSIACAMPLATVSAPSASIFAACYLYLIPIYNYIIVLISKKY